MRMLDSGVNFRNKKVFSGVPEGLDATILIEKIRSKNSTLVHVVRDDLRALALKSALNFFDPTIHILDFPAWDCLPYDRVSPNKEISCLRMATLTSLLMNQRKVDLIITTVNAISQRVPPKQFLQDSSFILSVGKSYNREKLILRLVEMGYTQNSTVLEKGEFSIRGGIIDVYPLNMDFPTRLDFFGDQLDQAKVFEVETQLSKSAIYEILLCPVSEFVINEERVKCFRSNYRHNFDSNGLDDPLYAQTAHRPEDYLLPLCPSLDWLKKIQNPDFLYLIKP